MENLIKEREGEFIEGFRAPLTLAEPQGYNHPTYAQSLSAFGTPIHLEHSDGWILKRAIPDFDNHDAMGCYPLFSCRNWSGLSSDLRHLEGSLASFAAVLDPFGNYRETDLRECFPDLVLQFKEHFVTDLSRLSKRLTCSHHRRNARKALRQVRVELVENPSDSLNDWNHLYSILISRHQVRDIRAFSPCSFSWQLKVPGIVVFRALHQESVVGMLLWYAQGEIAYYHLGAFNTDGYDLNASFALFRTAIEYFADKKFRWLNLGAGAGATSSGDDGLTRFKRGWSTGTRTAYFCGRILNRQVYDRLAQAKGNPATTYFPAYRQGEFCKKASITDASHPEK